MSPDPITAEHRFAPNDAHLQAWWFRAYPEPTAAGFVRFDAPADIAFESWIDGPEAEASQVCNLVIDPVRNDVLYLRRRDRLAEDAGTEVRRFRRDDQPGYTGLQNDVLVELPPCPDMEGWDTIAPGQVSRFWLVPETGEVVYECEHPESHACDSESGKARYFTAAGEELVVPAAESRLAHVGFDGVTLWVTSDGESYLVDREGFVTQPVEQVTPFTRSLRATPDGFRIASSRVEDASTFVVARHLLRDGGVEHVELAPIDGQHSLYFDCVFRSDDELVCVDFDTRLSSPSGELLYYSFDLAIRELTSARMALPADRDLFFSDLFSGP